MRVVQGMMLGLILPVSAGLAGESDQPVSLFFLHNSVGYGLIEQGQMRQYLDDHNSDSGTSMGFWDHNYPHIGLTDPDGTRLGYAYSSVCGHNTNPDGLHQLWLESGIPQFTSARDSIMNHDVIAFKSCYRAVDFGGAQTAEELDAALDQYKTWYLEMRDFFVEHTEKIFVVVTPPPRHRLHPNTTVLRATYGRQFANWLKSSDFLGSRTPSNILVFDLFDLLAAPDEGQPASNMLRYEYELNHNGTDSHPNPQANAIIGPLLMQFMIEAGELMVHAEAKSWGSIKSGFR
jgi:hypothetical protein